MFWPGMNKAIEHTIENCDVYHEYCDSNPKEPMLPGPIPERPWEVIATDLFQWSSGDYLLVVNYYSRFIEVKLLENTYQLNSGASYKVITSQTWNTYCDHQ